MYRRQNVGKDHPKELPGSPDPTAEDDNNQLVNDQIGIALRLKQSLLEARHAVGQLGDA